MKQWFAIRVRSRAEKKVSALLQEKNIESYLPLQKKLRYWSDRKKLVDMPVIHGYVFVHIAPAERLMALQTRHVVGYVRFEGHDVIVPDWQMAAMRRMLGQIDFPVEINLEALRPGQRVRIRTGSMSGLVAELISIQGRNRITLRIPEMSFNLMVELPAEYIEVEKSQ